MSGSRHHVRGGQAGRPALAAPGASILGALALAGWLASSLGACGIGLSAATVGDTDGVDASVPAAHDTGAAVDAGTKMTIAVPVADAAAGGAMSAAAQGSPLCGVALTGDAGSACDPDNGACTPPASPATASLDAAVSPEAADGGDAGVGRFGCRVTAVHAEAGVVSVAPVCKAAGDGKNESTCQGSSDCAPGFECVVDASRTHADGAATSGVCRRYCCDNICPGERSFCDIETTLGGSIAVPVCVARPATVAPDGGAPCELLNDTSCGAVGLACQVVNPDTGQVACVTPGTATAGQSCEVQKCAKGLSCILGYFPERRCAQLCNDDRDDCPSGQTCAPNAELSSVNAGIGVCSP